MDNIFMWSTVILVPAMLTGALLLARRGVGNWNHELAEKLFDDIFHDLSHKIFSNPSEPVRGGLLIQSGELYPKDYAMYAKVIKKKIDDLLELQVKYGTNQKLELQINIICGSRIMVDELSKPLDKIHPMIELLFSEKYGQYMKIEIIRGGSYPKTRIPYHYAVNLNTGFCICEMPHREGSKTITWEVEGGEFLVNSLQLYRKAIIHEFQANLLTVQNNKLFLGEIDLNENPSARKQLFFKAGIRRFIYTYFKPGLSHSLKEHRKRLGLMMIDWVPGSPVLFNAADMEKLS